MSDTGLTKRQRQVLEFIHRETRRKGYPPSVREIGEALDMRSPSTVHGHLQRLMRKGYIRRDPNKRRAIEMLRPPESFGESDDGRPSADRAAGDAVRPRQPRWIPLLGRVTAGQPVLAVENIEDWFPLAGDMSADEGRLFALRVRGDSMINAGIMDGDIVIVRSQETADNGAIVVALLGEEATVKRLYKEKTAIRLQAANPAYDDIVTTSATILGKVIGLYRRLGG